MKKFLWLCVIVLLGVSRQLQAAEFQKVLLVTADEPSKVECAILDVFQQRIKEKSNISIDIITSANFSINDSAPAESLIVLIGVGTENKALNQVLQQRRIAPITRQNPGQEGFFLTINPTLSLLAGVDHRGLLYGVGEFLRQCHFLENKIALEPITIRRAPAFEVRGTQYGQSSVAFNKGKVRRWTKSDRERAILDLALAGANTFMLEKQGVEEERLEFEFLKSFDLLVTGTFNANMPGKQDFPESWRASESIGRLTYVCPSVPEAYQHMLQEAENRFSKSITYDFIQLKGGDGGGCECDRCRPYGHVFIHLSEEVAKIIHRYHPKTRLYFTNQKFDNESDLAVLNYLNEKPRSWLWAWGYGPGSDATTWQPGHRQNHRMDLFEYPGFGPYGLYPKELLHQLPPQQKLIYFNEITHWKYAQHAYIQMYPRADKEGNLPPAWSHEIYERRPDQKLTLAYDRLTFYAWPRYYYRVFHDLMRYGSGDITHSSGNHDHFNQWMWQRLLWNPRLTVEQVVEEYTKNWFGRVAAPLMAKAIFQLESNMEELPNEPLEIKEGIDAYYLLVEEAGTLMPKHLKANNWLWYMYMQKGVLDKYIKTDAIRQVALQSKIERTLKENPNASSEGLIREIEQVLQQPSAEMKMLKEYAMSLGEESNRLFGTRSDAMFNLEHDYVGLGWMKRQLTRIIEAKSKVQKQQFIAQIVDYEGKTSDAIYDNLGTANYAPNVINGYPYDHGQPYVGTMLSEANRPSQRSMHFTQEEEQGVTLLYTDLDVNEDYEFQVTLVRPIFQERYRERMKQHRQSIYANGHLIVDKIVLPEHMSDRFSFSIPKKLLQDGVLKIEFKSEASALPKNRVTIEQWRNTGGWGTIVAETWLVPKRN